MNLTEFNETIEYAEKCNNAGIDKHMDTRKIFRGFNFLHIKSRLNSDELNYYFDNYKAISQINRNNNLSIARTMDYLKFFYKNNTDLSKVVLNKKIKVTKELVINKIKSTLQYDFDSFTIKIGNLTLQCLKSEAGIYKVCKYNPEVQEPIKNYELLYIVELPNLQLKEVTW